MFVLALMSNGPGSWFKLETFAGHSCKKSVRFGFISWKGQSTSVLWDCVLLISLVAGIFLTEGYGNSQFSRIVPQFLIHKTARVAVLKVTESVMHTMNLDTTTKYHAIYYPNHQRPECKCIHTSLSQEYLNVCFACWFQTLQVKGLCPEMESCSHCEPQAQFHLAKTGFHYRQKNYEEIIDLPGQKTASLRNGANGLMLEVGNSETADKLMPSRLSMRFIVYNLLL